MSERKRSGKTKTRSTRADGTRDAQAFPLRLRIPERAAEGFANLTTGDDETSQVWRDARERIAELLQENPEFAASWNQPLYEGDVEDELLKRARSGEFSRKAYAARYGAADHTACE